MKMRKTIAMASAMAMLAMGALTFTGCSEEEQTQPTAKTVMNVSLNPAVEFVLDVNNQVISVNALNEEGNLIVSSEAFTDVLGKDAAIAVKSFVQVSEDMGFLIKSSAAIGEEEVKISVSGDLGEANALYTNIEAAVNAYFVEADISATVSMEDAITEIDLRAAVAQCAPYLADAEVQALSYMELVETVYESRKETADMYSQELKNAYYEAKAIAMESAKLEALKEQLPTFVQGAVDAANDIYIEMVEAVEGARKSLLVNEDSVYQTLLQALREAKVQYLNYREEVAAMEQTDRTEAILARLEQYKTAVDNAMTSLEAKAVEANAQIDSLRADMKVALDEVISAIELVGVKVGDHLTEISVKQQEAQAQFFTKFESDYAAAITSAKTSWAEMKAELQVKVEAGEQPQA